MARRRPGPRNAKDKDGWHAYGATADAERAALKDVLTMGLAWASRDPCADMCWTAPTFRKHILFLYGLVLAGWPRDIVFRNPSKITPRDVQRLLALYAQCRLHFRRATAGELFAAQESLYNAAPNVLFAEPLPETCRSNLGKWTRPTVDAVKFPPRRARNGPKSKRWVDSDSE